MATITKQDNSYHIMVSCGYDIHNRQIRKCMTWNPNPGMTNRQIEKAFQEAAILFENKVRLGHVTQTSATFVDFVERWLDEYGGKVLQGPCPTRFYYIRNDKGADLDDGQYFRSHRPGRQHKTG